MKIKFKKNKKVHLGDRIAQINYLLNNYDDIDYYDAVQDDYIIFNILDHNKSVFINNEDIKVPILDKHIPVSDEYEQYIRSLGFTNMVWGAFYHQKYLSTIKKYVGGDYVCYNFDCGYKKEDKIPPYINDALNILSKKYELRKVGLPLNILQSIDELVGCRFYIGTDNGITHLARCIYNLPIYIIEYEFPIGRGFPPDVCEYTKLNTFSSIIQI